MQQNQAVKLLTVKDEAGSDTDKWLEIFSIFIHDIESPLASIKYLLKIITEGKFDFKSELHQRMVQSSKIAIERSESIIYDIMAVAKAGKVGIPVSLSTITVNKYLEESARLGVGAASENGIKVILQDNIPLVNVSADPKLLPRILDNLLYNAIRHTPSGGTINIDATEGEDYFFIHIKDSGPGLGDFDPSLLFEKYGQLELRTQGKHRGVGLGLYFCKLAATGMGGTLFADDHPDGGAVFSLKLNKVKES